ncbi:MAG TPA: hypothetical protein VD813_10780, partial [Pseudonocardia sp.]|nr:hypothetical protein [Pseudonocardia sp.]
AGLVVTGGPPRVPSGSTVPAPTTVPAPVPGGEPTEGTTEAGEPGDQPAAGTGARGGGVVVAPELPRSEDPIGDLIAGGRPSSPPVLPDPNTPGGDRVDPSEFDPNRAPDLVPVDPGGLGQETFPGRDDELERILAPSGVPGLFTAPRGREEVVTTAGTPATEPAPAPAPVGEPVVARPAPPVPFAPSATRQEPSRYSALPGGRTGVVVDSYALSGTGSPRDTAGAVTVVQDPQTGRLYAAVQGTRARNADGTEVVIFPQFPGAERVGYNPAGDTVAVFRLPEGQNGRVTPATPVQRVTVRTEAAPAIALNGGGGSNAVGGSVWRDPIHGNETRERVTVIPASVMDYDTGVRTYSAMVPRGQENADLAGGLLEFTVPAGTPLVRVTRTEQVFTPFTPAPLSSAVTTGYTAPDRATGQTPPVTTTRVAPVPRTTPAPRTTTSSTAAPQEQRNGLQRAGDWIGENVVEPAGEALRAYDRWSREQLRLTIVGSAPRDGVAGFGVTAHDVWFMDGGHGVYDPRGNLVQVVRGNPPATVDSTQLFLRGLGGSSPAFPAAPGGGTSFPRLRPAFGR